VAGEFKRGKSTLINALIGAELLPSGVVPLTSVVTELRGGAPATMTVRLESGEVFDAPLAMLASYVTETANPRNEKGVREVVLTIPAIDPGMHLVDTPGVGSVYEHNSDVTMGYLPSADAVVFVISSDQPLGRQELAFLQTIRVHAGKVFVALNKVDHLSPPELAQSREFLERELAAALGAVPPCSPSRHGRVCAHAWIMTTLPGRPAAWPHLPRRSTRSCMPRVGGSGCDRWRDGWAPCWLKLASPWIWRSRHWMLRVRHSWEPARPWTAAGRSYATGWPTSPPHWSTSGAG